MIQSAPPFTLSRGEPGRIDQLRRLGLVPWWTPDALRLAFWRPLASLTHALDEAVAPGSAVAAHAHNLLLLALLVLAVGQLYRLHGLP